MTETDILGDLEEASRVLDSFIASGGAAEIEKAGKIMAESLRNGGKIISCGNGGSNCDAMHFAEELTGRYRNDRRALGAVACDNPGHLTCVGNDYGFKYVFSRFVEGVGRPGTCFSASPHQATPETSSRLWSQRKRPGLRRWSSPVMTAVSSRDLPTLRSGFRSTATRTGYRRCISRSSTS